MKIGLLQMNIQIGDVEANFTKAESLMTQAVQKGAQLLILPELWNTGYALERAAEIADLDGTRSREFFSRFANEHHVAIIGGSVLYRDSQTNHVTNTMLAFDERGQEVLRYDKTHLFRLMDEDLFLQAGDQLGLLDLLGIPMGVMICYDLRFPELSRRMVMSGAKMLVNVAEWPTARVDHWRTLQIARAIENQCFFVSVNRVGESKGTDFAGQSMVIGPWGEVLHEGSSDEQVYVVDIDINQVGEVRKRIPVFEDRRPDVYEGVVE